MKKISALITFILVAVVIFSVSAFAAEIGDVNNDGKVNAQDARSALRIAAQLEAADESVRAVADVNSDGKVNAADARKILRVAAQLESFDRAEPTPPANNDGKIALDDAMGADINEYAEKFGLEKDDYYRVAYESDDLYLLTEGSSSKNPGHINYIDIRGGNYSYLGLYVGLTLSEAEALLDAQKIEYEFEDYKDGSASIYIDGTIAIMVGLIDSEIVYVTAINEIGTVYDIDLLLDMPAEYYFLDFMNYEKQAIDSNEYLYTAQGISVYCIYNEEYDETLIYSATITDESDYNFYGIYVGDSFSEVEMHADMLGLEFKETGPEENCYYIEDEFYDVYFDVENGIVTQISIVSTIE